MADLHDFEGFDVIGTRVKLTNTGDGLSESMGVDPMELRLGDRVIMVIEGVVADVAFPPAIKGEYAGPRYRVHTIRGGAATFVDDDLVETALAEQKERNLLAREEAAGIARLPLADDEDGDEIDEEAADGG
jgi:hypothetical protein